MIAGRARAGSSTTTLASLTFVLPRAHVGALTRAAGSGNLAVMAQWVGLLPRLRTTWSTAPTTVAACLWGLPERLWPSKPRPAASATNARPGQVTLPLVPVWKNASEQASRRRRGLWLRPRRHLMAQSFPASRFVGLDVSEPALGAARPKARSWVSPTPLSCNMTPASLDGKSGTTSLPTFSTPSTTRPVRPGPGRYRPGRSGREGFKPVRRHVASSTLAENISHPIGPFLYTASCLHCIVNN